MSPTTAKWIAAGSALAIAACVAGAPAEPGGVPTTAPAERAVRSIVLPNLTPEMPPGPKAGRETVAAACSYCHSTRYLFNQPPLSRKTWTAEVQKMRTVFGAPVAEQQIQDIVDYLAAVRGIDDPATRP